MRCQSPQLNCDVIEESIKTTKGETERDIVVFSTMHDQSLSLFYVDTMNCFKYAFPILAKLLLNKLLEFSSKKCLRFTRFNWIRIQNNSNYYFLKNIRLNYGYIQKVSKYSMLNFTCTVAVLLNLLFVKFIPNL